MFPSPPILSAKESVSTVDSALNKEEVELVTLKFEFITFIIPRSASSLIRKNPELSELYSVTFKPDIFIVSISPP